ncbi:MAG: hypothetical protein K2H79_07725 [Bacteroidaceae bacterium]|nr:hypothetical protein [Bacteroidaceae bacterium]MDE7165567.1 hypothetical protein [Bacteroidaceae bacterium]
MEEVKKQRGGRRPGAGRPANGRNIQVSFKISLEAYEILNKQANRSKFIDELIKDSAKD